MSVLGAGEKISSLDWVIHYTPVGSLMSRQLFAQKLLSRANKILIAALLDFQAKRLHP
jgi:hypothetical protein